MPSAVSPSGFKPLKESALFQPLKFGRVNLEHRIVLAPLTRMRATKESDGVFVQGDLAVQYYGERATKGGFMLTEATDIHKYAGGYPGVPGVFTPSQLAGWKRVTDAVHAKGGVIFCQIWHTGRASPPSFRGGAQPVSSGTSSISGNALDGTKYSDNPPRPMTVDEIHETTREFGAAAKRALEAGFDGVEIHGANGYLLDQFLHDNINNRTDDYGGSVENRARFVLEVIKEVTSAIGGDRVGIRLSPYNYFQDTKDSDPNSHWATVATMIADLPEENRPLYVHSVEPRFDEVLDEKAKLAALGMKNSDDAGVEAHDAAIPQNRESSLVPIRNILQKRGIKFVAAGGFDRDNAVPKVESGDADLIVFGRHFLANPDYVTRLREGHPLNKYDRTTFYGGDQKGYIDYPALDAK